MELRHLRYFLAVHEHRNFTRASETLNVSQPTLSQQIRDMEEGLGCLLFHREYHQLIPTDAGELTRRYAREVLSTVDELTHNIQELQGMRHGCLRLGVIQTFNAYYLPDILGSFARDKPSINIEVEELANGDLV